MISTFGMIYCFCNSHLYILLSCLRYFFDEWGKERENECDCIKNLWI